MCVLSNVKAHKERPEERYEHHPSGGLRWEKKEVERVFEDVCLAGEDGCKPGEGVEGFVWGLLVAARLEVVR